MLVSLSGSQGAGKSTVLESLKDAGFKVVENKTARSILKEWNLSLGEINRDRDLVKKFQDTIIDRHLENITPYINTPELVVQERNFIEIFSYCLFQLSQYNEYNEWFYQYHDKCLELQKVYKKVIYLDTIPNKIVVDDGVRSTNRFFSNAVNLIMVENLKKLNNVVYVSTTNHDERVKIIGNKLKELQERVL